MGVKINRDHLHQEQQIETVASDWQLQGRSNDGLWQSRPLSEARAFQRRYAATYPLSTTAEQFIRQSLRLRYNNRLKLVVFGLIVPLGLAVHSGSQIATYLRLRPYWDVVNSHTESNPVSGSTLVRALEELNREGRSLRKVYLSDADLSRAYLTGANLSDANLSNANLSNANLSNADLSLRPKPRLQRIGDRT